MNIAPQIVKPEITTDPLPASTRIYIPGEIHPAIRVPMRQIAVHPTAGEPPVNVYDTSGPSPTPLATSPSTGVLPASGPSGSWHAATSRPMRDVS